MMAGRKKAKNDVFKLMELMALTLERSRHRTLELLSQVPEGLLAWSPSVGKFSIEAIFRHIYEIDLRWRTALEGPGAEPPPATDDAGNPLSLVQILQWSGKWRADFVCFDEGEQLFKHYDAPGGGDSLGFDAMQYLLRHEAYNQAVIVGYLRAMGLEGRAIHCFCHELGVDLKR